MSRRSALALLATLFMVFSVVFGVLVPSAQADMVFEPLESCCDARMVASVVKTVEPLQTPTLATPFQLQLPSMAISSHLSQKLISVWSTVGLAMVRARQLLWMLTRQWYVLIVKGNIRLVEALVAESHDL